MKTTPRLCSANPVRRIQGTVTVVFAVLSAALLGGVPVQAASTSYWIAPAAADWSVAADWSPSGVPNSQSTYAVVTNSFACDFSSADTYTVGGLFIGTNLFGTVSMNGGTLNVSNSAAQYVFTIGGGAPGASILTGNVGSPGAGNFTMSGGTLNVARDTSSFQQDGFVMGLDTGSSGTFSISGGTANIWCGIEIGCEGAGTLNVSGGALVGTGWFHVGEGINSASADGNGTATFNLGGGAVYILPNNSGGIGSINGGLCLNQGVSNAMVNISGGTVYCTEINMSEQGGIATNTLNIVGGSIYVGPQGVQSNATASVGSVNYINISGGTFHTVDMSIYGKGGGLGDTNNILSDGTNWTWAATLPANLTNSTFTAPNAAGGTATGPGYVTFAPETGRTITLNNQWSGVGGFVVNGPGTVVAATGLQNVGGGITVSNGTLVTCGTILNSSAIFVGTNAALFIGTNTSTPGTLTADNVTFRGPGSALDVALNATPGVGSNSLLVATNLTLDSANSVLNIVPLATPTVGDIYVIAQYSGTLTGAFSTVTNSAGYSYSVSYANHEISVTVQSVSTVYNWVAPSPADWSVASDWDVRSVPNSLNAIALFTNGIACDLGSADNYTVGQISLGTWDNTSGSLAINGGALYVSNTLNYYDVTIGGWTGTGQGGDSTTPQTGNGSTGSLTVNSGTVTVSKEGNGAYYQDGFLVGLATNSTGTFTINGGTLNTLCGIEIGINGSGTFNVNGGTVVDNGWFGIGRGNANSAQPNGSGTLNVTSGALYVLPNNGEAGSIGFAGLDLNNQATNSMANISGGTVYASDISFSGANVVPRPADTLNISGGALYIGSAGVYSNGGNIFIPSVNISGGTFHTADILASDGGGGAYGAITNVLSDGTNWTWTVVPPVNLTNGPGPGFVTFAPEPNRTITLSNQWTGTGGITMSGSGSVVLDGANNFSGPLTLNSGTLEIGAAQNDTGGLAFNGGDLTIVSGSLLDSTITVPGGSTLYFANSGTLTFTNVVGGAGDVAMVGSGTVNVGGNLQNTGAIIQNNGTLEVNGSILDAHSVTNSGPASAGMLLAQGIITPPMGIGTNSSLEVGTIGAAGTLNASNVIINGALISQINTATTPGGGTNDLLICSNLTLGANSILDIAPLSLPTTGGSYLIAEYASLTGTFGLVTNTMRGAVMSVSYVAPSGSVPGKILLTVNSTAPGSLTWAAQIGAANINWDVKTSLNWTNTATSALSTFDQQDAVTFGGTPNATSITNRVSVTGLVLPSSITVNGGLPYIFSGAGQIGGGASLTYNDTNTSGIYTAGNTYSGNVTIDTGVLQLGDGGSSWLGQSNTTYVSGGTLDLNGQNVGAEPLVLSGAGITTGVTNGAINNSSTNEPGTSGGPFHITLAGDTTINASGVRWDIGTNALGAGGGSFTGNGHNLVKIGPSPIWMHEVGDIGVGNIDIQQGELGFQYTIGMGISSDTLTVEPGAELGFYQLADSLNKLMVLNGNATLASGGGGPVTTNSFIGPITLNGTNTILTTTNGPLNLGGNIGGAGGFVFSGAGPLLLGGVDTYSGPTIIGAGSTLALESGASIGKSSLIYLTPSANTILDASAAGSATLNSGQTLEGAGAVNGNVTANSGSIISLGTNATTFGTIIFTNNLTLNGNTNYIKISDPNNIGIDNDLISVNNQLTLTGVSTLVVSPLGPLSSGQPYTLIQAGGITGSVNNLTVISASPRYTMTPVINNGSVQVNVGGTAAPLEWKGNLSHNWDLVTSNWYNMGTANADRFYNGDYPTFDDTSTVTNVVITNGIIASGINMSNVNNTYTFSGGLLTVSGQLAMYGNGSTGGSLILGTTNAPEFASVDSHFGNLVYDLKGLANYDVTTVFGDSSFNGDGSVIFGGTNTVNLLGDNSAGDVVGSLPAFFGTFWVTNGVLRYTNMAALGDNDYGYDGFPIVVVTNNGTLDVNGVPLTAVVPEIAGNGFNGEGALYDSDQNAASGNIGGAVAYFGLVGNASIGSPSRWDQMTPAGGYGQINGNGFKLTKVGPGVIIFYGQEDGDTHLGDIEVAAGRLGFDNGPIALGNGYLNNVLSVDSNAVVTFYGAYNQFDTVHGGIQKPMWLKGGAQVDSAGTNSTVTNNYSGPIFLSGTNLFGTRSILHLWNSIMDSNGPSGFILGDDSVGPSAAALYLDGTNSYSGPTIISNQTLHVDANSSLGLSTYVQVNGAARLDLSALPNYSFGTVQTNQMLSGAGTVLGPAAGNLNFNAGGTLAVGLPGTNGLVNTNTYTLTISNNLVFNSGSTNYVVVNKTSAGAGAVPADEVTGLTSVTLGGTLVITNFGKSFVAGDSIKLFNAATYHTNGFTVNNIIPAAPGPNLAWSLTSLGSSGTVTVVSNGSSGPSFTNGPPISFSQANNQLMLTWPSSYVGYYYLEIQTNPVTVGLSNNWIPYGGSIADTLNVGGVTNAINNAKDCVFYRLMTNAP